MADTIATALDQVPYRITNPELIPTRRYYDEAFFQLEKERLWPHMWQMACRLEEIPDVGDYTVYTILEHSVLMLHTQSGVKAFKNACRHRGVRLAHGPGHCGAEGLVCPFHGWRWNAEGENTFVFGRQIFSEELLDRAEIDLAPVRVEFWAGCAFINFDDDAPSLREFLGPVADRMDARHADKLKMDWWCGTILPTNWKLAMEAFQEGYHTMQTHPQLFHVSPNATKSLGRRADGQPVNEDLDARQTIDMSVDFMAKLSEGMDGMVHKTEVAVLEKMRDMDVPEDPAIAGQMFYGRAYQDVTEDARARGAPIFDLLQVAQSQEFHAVEFMFPHYFLLPMLGAMSSYRIRPLTAETCLFEIWSLVIRPEGEPYETPTEPTMLPYNSPDFPEIPRQDYYNLPLQQLGLHDIEHMRLSKTSEGMLSNYQRLIDGYIARLDRELLTKAGQLVNSGFEAPVLDIGF
ncbi:aromatic ring-hydroxylating dioxygenase subunit alpha [Novosphingobium sp. G106]|uniref:aromatic ring-hydroxylating oxygenase subunit alpha n=1 Tax=Novosphingobium sp. G106 TaxID=2849500 RepID=UPI001C2D6018|nr:aromatic ring-hydroxylating dioxygenase subunit alpha [Novosphingobium sp. G106]MBV1686320.1 aromatic ring-hydroxylating dioxygenase subunit alpha [Novosphingobium sp. G106]